MIYRDTITIIEPVIGVHQEAGGARHSVKCVVEQTSGLRRGGSYDAMAGDARAYLDASDGWLKSVGYRVENCFAEVSLFGRKNTYRVSNVAIGRAVVTSGAAQHIEVELSSLDREVA